MRLIDADALKRHYAWWKDGTREMTMDEAKSDFDTIIDLQPTIEPKRGKWVKTKYGFEQCSLCKVSGSVIWKFCPRCGARMDEVEKDG